MMEDAVTSILTGAVGEAVGNRISSTIVRDAVWPAVVYAVSPVRIGTVCQCRVSVRAYAVSDAASAAIADAVMAAMSLTTAVRAGGWAVTASVAAGDPPVYNDVFGVYDTPVEFILTGYRI